MINFFRIPSLIKRFFSFNFLWYDCNKYFFSLNRTFYRLYSVIRSSCRLFSFWSFFSNFFLSSDLYLDFTLWTHFYISRIESINKLFKVYFNWCDTFRIFVSDIIFFWIFFLFWISSHWCKILFLNLLSSLMIIHRLYSLIRPFSRLFPDRILFSLCPLISQSSFAINKYI